MLKKIVITLLLIIPVLFGVFYLAVGGSDSKEEDVDRLAVYMILRQEDKIARDPWLYEEVKQRMLEIQSKYEFNDRAELKYLMYKRIQDFNEKKDIAFLKLYQREKHEILKKYSK